MANKKITQLDPADLPLTGTEEAEIVQDGVNKRVAISNFGGGSGGVQSVTGDTVDNTDPDNPVVGVPDLQEVLTAGGTVIEGANEFYLDVAGAIFSYGTPETSFIVSDGSPSELIKINQTDTDLQGILRIRETSEIELEQINTAGITKVTIEQPTATTEWQVPAESAGTKIFASREYVQNFAFSSVPNEINIIDDFIGRAYATGITNGNSGGSNVTGDPLTGAQGVQTSSTGTGSTGAGGTVLGEANSSTFYIGGGAISYERRIYIPILSTSGERFIIFEGFQSNASFTNTVNGVLFLYDEGGTYASGANAGSPNWKCVTINASTRTFTTTSVAVSATTFVKLRIEINANATSVDFYIDNILVATHTTNIPATSTALHQRNYIAKSVGTTARTVQADWIALRQKLTTSR